MKYFKFFFFLLILLLFASIIYFLPRAIRVRAISCKSQFGPCSLGDKLSVLEGKNLFEAKKDAAHVLGSEDTISEFSIQYKIPDRLEVAVIEKKPKFALKEKNSSTFLLVDKEGTVLRITEENSLPQVSVEGKLPNVGEKVSGEQLFALNLIYSVYAYYQVREGAVEEGSLAVYLPGNLKAIFPLKGEPDVLLGALRLIIGRLNERTKDTRINELGISQVDLRFKNPVLK